MEIPKGEEARKEWLLNWMNKNKRWSPDVIPAIHESLVKWYGEGMAAKVEYSESFEVCEYGHQPTDEEIRQLFPMLGN